MGTINPSVCNTYGGQCNCKQNIYGRTCASCLPEHYNFTSGLGCISKWQLLPSTFFDDNEKTFFFKQMFFRKFNRNLSLSKDHYGYLGKPTFILVNHANCFCLCCLWNSVLRMQCLRLIQFITLIRLDLIFWLLYWSTLFICYIKQNVTATWVDLITTPAMWKQASAPAKKMWLGAHVTSVLAISLELPPRTVVNHVVVNLSTQPAWPAMKVESAHVNRVLHLTSVTSALTDFTISPYSVGSVSFMIKSRHGKKG